MKSRIYIACDIKQDNNFLRWPEQVVKLLKKNIRRFVKTSSETPSDYVDAIKKSEGQKYLA